MKAKLSALAGSQGMSNVGALVLNPWNPELQEPSEVKFVVLCYRAPPPVAHRSPGKRGQGCPVRLIKGYQSPSGPVRLNLAA